MTTKTSTDLMVEAVETVDAVLAILEAPADPLASGRAKLAAHDTSSLTDAELAELKAIAPRRSAADILALKDQETEDVYVPQWDTIVTIRSLTGTERDHYEASLVSYRRDEKGQPQVNKIELENIRARLISLVAIDAKGDRMWSPQQILPLGEKNASALELLKKTAERLSNLTPPAIEAAKEALGNAPSGEPGSSSLGILE
jgi:hypothetical protein